MGSAEYAKAPATAVSRSVPQALPFLWAVFINPLRRGGEMADAADLKSAVPQGTCRFDSDSRQAGLSRRETC